MKKLLPFFLLAFALNVAAQNETHQSWIVPTSLNVSLGAGSFTMLNFLNYQEFLSAAHLTLQPDLSDSSGYSLSSNPAESDVRIQILIGFQTRHALEKNSSHEWLAGFSYRHSQIEPFAAQKTEHLAGDTFFSANEIITTDTDRFWGYSYGVQSADLSVEIGRVYYTNPAHRFQLSAGLCTEIGVTIDQLTFAGYWNSSTLNYYKNGEQLTYGAAGDNGFYQTQHGDMKNGFFIRPFVPLGANFSLSKKDNLLHHINISTQVILGLGFTSLGNAGSYLTAFESWNEGVIYRF